MIYYLIITAITVSLDSFICGISLSLGKSKKLPLVAIITLTVYLMCIITNYGTLLLKDFITEKTTIIGGIILVSIGLYNLIKKDKDTSLSQKNFFIQSLSVGFAVGLDGALANLSLSLMGINAFYVPITIAATHGLMILLSVLFTQTKTASKLEKFSFIGPLILIFLGLYKIIALI